MIGGGCAAGFNFGPARRRAHHMFGFYDTSIAR
jgi:hypothetical protein